MKSARTTAAAGAWVQAAPTEYLVHFRLGRVVREGLGRSALLLPFVDRALLVSCAAHSLSFEADQVTRENQGVLISGFAVWRIAAPRTTLGRFAFGPGDDPVAVIGGDLRDVVESAIRHCVANMTIEEVLRRRATIILELKRELQFITEAWGLEIDTIEIKAVKILSTQVFGHLQARYREELRLASETCALETERELARRRLAQKDEEAAHELAVRLHDAERAQELRLRQLALAAAADRAEEEALATRASLEAARRALEADAKRHAAELARLEAESTRARAEAGNVRRADLELIETLPRALGALKVDQLTVTPEVVAMLGRLVRAMLPAA